MRNLDDDRDDVVVVNFRRENGYFVRIKVGHGNEIGSCVVGSYRA